MELETEYSEYFIDGNLMCARWKYPGKEESEVRSQLGIIKHTAEIIDNRVQEALELNRADKYREER